MRNKLIVGLGALFLSTAAFAYGTEAGSVTVTPGVGAYMFDNARDISTTPMGSLSVGYHFNQHWGAEALLGGMHPTTKNDSNEFNGRLVLLDGVYHFANKTNFEPFLLAGIGELILHPTQALPASNGSSSEPDSQTNVNGGFGAQYFFSNFVALRADVRDLYSTTANTGKNDVLADLAVSFQIG